MPRTKGSFGPRTKEAIQEAGVGLIYRHGYEGMSLRDLARAVGIQQGSLYNHIGSKQELLFELMDSHLKAIIAGVDTALAGITEPIAQLKAFTAFHVSNHMERQREVYINNSELRSLATPNRRKIISLREAYEGRLIAILRRGAAMGTFKISNAKLTAFAVIATLTGICAWYNPKGRLSKAALVDLHTALVLHGVLGNRR